MQSNDVCGLTKSTGVSCICIRLYLPLSLSVCVCVCVCVCQLMANHSTTLVARSRLIDLPVTLAAFVIHIRSVGSTAFSSRRVHTDARPMMLCAKGTG